MSRNSILSRVRYSFGVSVLFVGVFSSGTKTEAAVDESPKEKAQYCESRLQPGHFIRMATQPENHLAFKNRGGLLNKGVCWWHSLFQRAAIYIAVFRPELPKPTLKQAQYIVHQLARGWDVVEVPGYKNIYEFSRDWEPLIQNKLESWQLTDGLLKFAWIQGLSGSSQVDPLELQGKILRLRDRVNDQQDIQWVMTQLKGISAHSWSVIDVELGEAGAVLSALDSNYVGVVKAFPYVYGERSMRTPMGDAVPYIGREKDLKRFKLAAERYCQSRRLGDFSSLTDAEIDHALSMPLDNDF